MPTQTPLPPTYTDATEAALRARIAAAKARLGARLCILGHHYQQDDVVAFADFTGDSLKLSQLAAEQKDANYIVFCGVHFMAESADILTSERQIVILPDLTAGCSMADMAHIDQVEAAWPALEAWAGQTITPITYVNSSAAVKAFVGRKDGACCTSSNAKRVIEWALRGADPSNGGVGGKIMFLPDQHLGRNTAYALGWPLESMVVYDPHQPFGGLSEEDVRAARFILWKGHCSVHALFKPEQCDALRRQPEPWNILVHPECTWEVVQKADFVGSTEYIIRTLREAPAGTHWAVGTEIHLVNRLAAELQGQKTVRSLAGFQCLCSTMYRIDPRRLCWVLENLVEGRVVNQVTVDAETRHWARVALDRMLALRPAQPVSAR